MALLSLPIAVLGSEQLESRRPSVASGCPDWVISETETSPNLIHPDKVVVEPWQGRHNVFATFTIPKGYQANQFFVVTLKGSNPYCGAVTRGIPTSNGDREVVGMFRTRTTLWVMSKGQLGQLEEPSNWKLAIFKPS
jgi:hypothetical protein